ncbi:MAG TPA: hypothetical protein VGK64_06960 [Bryobacteraceae bacterium]
MQFAVSDSCGKALKNTNDQCSFDHKRSSNPHRPDFLNVSQSDARYQQVCGKKHQQESPKLP